MIIKYKKKWIFVNGTAWYVAENYSCLRRANNIFSGLLSFLNIGCEIAHLEMCGPAARYQLFLRVAEFFEGGMLLFEKKCVCVRRAN